MVGAIFLSSWGKSKLSLGCLAMESSCLIFYLGASMVGYDPEAELRRPEKGRFVFYSYHMTSDRTSDERTIGRSSPRGAAARIVISSKIEDARAQSTLRTLKNLFPEAALQRVAISASYTVDAKLLADELERAAERLANPVTERYSTSTLLAPEKWSYALEIGYLPGVTDNLGRTVQETIEDCLGRKFSDEEAVYSSTIIFLEGALDRSDVERFARELHNPLIERAGIYKLGETIPVVAPKVKMHEVTSVAT